MTSNRFVFPLALLAALVFYTYYTWCIPDENYGNLNRNQNQIRGSLVENVEETKKTEKTEKTEHNALFIERLIKRMAADKLVPSFINFKSPYVISPTHNLSICCISKSMSTMMRGVTCSLYDTAEFLRNNRSVLENYDGRFCEGKNEYGGMKSVEKAMGGRSNFTKIAVIRNPIDRFISFFIDKCVNGDYFRPKDRCYGCKNNVTCFLEQQYQRFLEYASNPHTTLKPSLEDYHTAPFTWNCEFGRYLKDYKIVKLDPKFKEPGVKELMKIFKDNRVAETTVAYIEKSILGGETVHATYASREHDAIMKEIRESRAIRQLLRKMYYLDFVIFGFDTSFIDE